MITLDIPRIHIEKCPYLGGSPLCTNFMESKHATLLFHETYENVRLGDDNSVIYLINRRKNNTRHGQDNKCSQNGRLLLNNLQG